MTFCQIVDRTEELVMDPSGFWVLIRPNFTNGTIEVAICHKNAPLNMSTGQRIVEIFYGRCPVDIYHRIFQLQPQYITTLGHAAYLGKELKKAELALALGIGVKGWYQE